MKIREYKAYTTVNIQTPSTYVHAKDSISVLSILVNTFDMQYHRSSFFASSFRLIFESSKVEVNL